MASNIRPLVFALAFVVGVSGYGASILARQGDSAPVEDPKDEASPGNKPERPTKAALDALLPVKSRHIFAPVNDEWKTAVAYLLNERGEDPPTSLLVIKPEDRDPTFKAYCKEVRYFANNEDRDRRIRRYYPNGSLLCDMDIVGDEQFDCSYGPDGDVRGYVHWRKGKWVAGYSVSPDGATVHRLAGGTGELVTYGNKTGNSEHRWYCEGINFLVKRYQDGLVTSIRVNGADDWIMVNKSGEQLLVNAEHEMWNKPVGGIPYMQKLDGKASPGFDNRRRRDSGEAQRVNEQYRLRRAAFLESYGAFLTTKGYGWDRLKIEFLRKGTTWPY